MKLSEVIEDMASRGWEAETSPELSGSSGLVHRFGYIISLEGRRIAVEEVETLDEKAFLKYIGRYIDTGIPMILLYEKLGLSAERIEDVYWVRILPKSDVDSLEAVSAKLVREFYSLR